MLEVVVECNSICKREEKLLTDGKDKFNNRDFSILKYTRLDELKYL